MAINDTQKIDFLFKKLGYGVTKTDVGSVKNATNESIASPLLNRGDTIWTDAGQIPTLRPGASTAYVELYDDIGNSTIECSPDLTATPNRTWKTDLTDWIPAEFGSTYLVKVYIDNASAAAPQTTGTQLFPAGSGNNDEWFFDCQSGVLNFIGDNLPAGINGKIVYIVGARYVGLIGSNFEELNLGNFLIQGNTISTTNINGDIILDPNGTGNLTVITDNMIIDGSGALVIPVGTTAQRPTPNAQGMIRYNTTDATFEGFDGANWGSLGGVKDVDGDTYIVAEAGAGTDNDQLDFYTAGTQRFQIGATGDFKFGDTLTEVTIAGATGDTVIAGKLRVDGDVTVNGTTTTVNSTTVTIDDPIFTLGGDTAPTTDDNKDRGIEFNYFDTTAKVGFFGFDDSTGKFTFIPDSTNTNEVFSGTTGEIDAKLDWSNLVNIPAGGGSDTTYSISAETGTGGANLRLSGSDAVVDDVLIAAGDNVTVVRTDANTITISGDAAPTNAFDEFTVTDTDVGFTWTETGTATADNTTGELKFVSGYGININVDAASDAIRIENAFNNVSTSFTGDDTTTVFDTGNTTAAFAVMFLNGVLQKEILDYTFSAGILTFSVAPEIGDEIEIFEGLSFGGESKDFGQFTVSDTDAGFTWAQTGTVAASSIRDVLTLVSGEGIDIDVDATSGAIKIANTAVLSLADNINVDSVTIDTSYIMDSGSAVIATTNETALVLYDTAIYGAAKILIQAYDTVSGERQMSELLITHDGTTASATEYGIVYTGIAALASFNVDVNTGNVRVLITGTSSNSTEYKIAETVMLS